jgi:hypothetical protein
MPTHPAPFPPAGVRSTGIGGGPPVIDGTPPVTPFTVFQQTRGATFTTPGPGLTQAPATGGLLSLDHINPTYAEFRRTPNSAQANDKRGSPL